jgi:hypothetical protein
VNTNSGLRNTVYSFFNIIYSDYKNF